MLAIAFAGGNQGRRGIWEAYASNIGHGT